MYETQFAGTCDSGQPLAAYKLQIREGVSQLSPGMAAMMLSEELLAPSGRVQMTRLINAEQHRAGVSRVKLNSNVPIPTP